MWNLPVQREPLLAAGQRSEPQISRENRTGSERLQWRKRQFLVTGLLEFTANIGRECDEARSVPAVLLAFVHHLFIEGEHEVGVRVDFVAVGRDGRCGGLLLGGFFSSTKRQSVV